MKIVVSNNSFVFDELGSPGFLLVGVEPILVASGDEALAAVKQHRPELVVLEADLPGLDGCTVCERIKADPELRLSRVILVLQGSVVSAAQLQRLAASGCDDVLVYRVPGEDLYHHAARLCGLPDLSLGEPVQLRVWISGESTPEISSHAVHLSHRSVELLTSSALQVGARLTLRMHREGDAEAVEVQGEVAQVQPDPVSHSHSARVRFVGHSDQTTARLADLALWEARKLPDGLRIAIRGAFDQVTDFTNLRSRIAGDIIFDLSGVRQITSWGVRNWIFFLRSLPAESRYSFVNCSTVFVRHCSMIADMLGRGVVLSFALPYHCTGCGRDDERVLQTSSLSATVRIEPPEFRCSLCGGVERFDDIADRYFSFLPAPT